MRASIIIAVCLFSPAIFLGQEYINVPKGLPAPFGIKLGEIYEEDSSSSPTIAKHASKIYTIDAKSPLPQFQLYRITVSRKYDRISEIHAIGDNGKSPENRQALAKVKGMLDNKYGVANEDMPKKRHMNVLYYWDLGDSYFQVFLTGSNIQLRCVWKKLFERDEKAEERIEKRLEDRES